MAGDACTVARWACLGDAVCDAHRCFRGAAGAAVAPCDIDLLGAAAGLELALDVLCIPLVLAKDEHTAR